MEYAKAVETELNALIFPRLRQRLANAKLSDREVTVGSTRLDLGQRVSHQSLGTLLHLLEKSDTLARALGSALPSGIAGWLRGSAVAELAGVKELRNPAAHSEAVTRERVERVRARVCGVGCEGLLVRIARGKGK